MSYLFKSNRVYLLPVLLMVALLLRGWSMFDTAPVHYHFTMLSGLQLFNGMSSLFSSPVAQHILAMFMVCGQAVWINLIIKKYELIYRHTWMPALCFVICNSMFSEMNVITPQLFANIAIIAGYDHLLGCYKNEFSNKQILQTGMLFGLAFLVEFQSIYFILLIFYALPVLRVLNLREMILAFVGFLVPVYFMFGAYFLAGRFEEAGNMFIANFYKDDFPLTIFDDPIRWIPLEMIVFLFILGCIKLSSNYTKNMLKIRKFQNITIVMLPFSLILAAVGFESLFANLIYISVPASVFMAYYLLGNEWGWWKELLLLSLMGAIIYNQTMLHYIS